MQLRAIAALTCWAVLASGCFLMPKKRSSKKSGVTPGLLDRSSVYLDRIDDGSVARLQFKTTKAALCEMAYYAQDPGAKPTRESPEKAPCTERPGGGTEFSEKIPGLKADLLYFVVIRVWEAGGSWEKADQVIVQEVRRADSGTATSVVGGAPGGGGEADGGTSTIGTGVPHLWVARMNMPLRVAEVHKHDFPKSLSVAEIKQMITLTPGCQLGVPAADSAPLSEAADEVQLQNLVSQDFAAAAAKPHPDAKGRLQLAYGGLNDGVDKWTLLYRLAGKDTRIPVRPISRILTMEMESSDTVLFAEAQLGEAADPLRVDPAKPLKFKWTIGTGELEQSYLTVQIGRAGDDKSIYCVFPAKDRTGTIDPKFLQGLADGRHVVVTELVSHQIWQEFSWLVALSDWRSGRIEK